MHLLGLLWWQSGPKLSRDKKKAIYHHYLEILSSRGFMICSFQRRWKKKTWRLNKASLAMHENEMSSQKTWGWLQSFRSSTTCSWGWDHWELSAEWLVPRAKAIRTTSWWRVLALEPGLYGTGSEKLLNTSVPPFPWLLERWFQG